MELDGKVAVITGAASGIGAGLARRFAAEGARALVLADIDEAGAKSVAEETGGRAVGCNVADEGDVVGLIESTEAEDGPIDVFCSNAGIIVGGGPEAPNDAWQRIMDVNVMAHVYVARHLVPRMLERGEGYLVVTASAAGLLTQIGSAPYSVTKHAAVAFAEWLSVTYGDAGLKVSALCPQAVRTGMTGGGAPREGGAARGGGAAAVDGVLEADDVAEAVVAGMREESFLILPHPSVREYFQRKASDYDRWLNGMRRLQARLRGNRRSG